MNFNNQEVEINLNNKYYSLLREKDITGKLKLKNYGVEILKSY